MDISPLLGLQVPTTALLTVGFNSDDLADYVESFNTRQIHLAIEYALNTIFNPTILMGLPGKTPDDPDGWEGVDCSLRDQALYHIFEAGDETDKIMADFTMAALEIAYDDLVNKLSEDITSDSENEDVQCLYNELLLIKWITLIECRYLTPQNVLHTVLLMNYK